MWRSSNASCLAALLSFQLSLKCHESFVHLLIALSPGWTPQPRGFVMIPAVNEVKKKNNLKKKCSLRSRRQVVWNRMSVWGQFGSFELCTMADALLLLQYLQSGYRVQSAWIWFWNLRGGKREKIRCILSHILDTIFLNWNKKKEMNWDLQLNWNGRKIKILKHEITPFCLCVLVFMF